MTHRIDTLTVLDSPMEVFVCEPHQPGPHPAIVLCPHIPGAHGGIENDPYTLATARRYADSGFVVAVPFIFHWWPKTDDIGVKREGARDDRTAQDIRATVDHLSAMAGVDPARIGIVGHCWGGRVSWLGAASDDRLRACVVFYGGRIRLGLGDGNPPAISLAPRIACPVMGFFGNDDTNPPPADVDAYDAALNAAGVPHVFHRYDGAGHAFQLFDNPERYRPAASEDAWAKAVAFLHQTL